MARVRTYAKQFPDFELLATDVRRRNKFPPQAPPARAGMAARQLPFARNTPKNGRLLRREKRVQAKHVNADCKIS